MATAPDTANPRPRLPTRFAKTTTLAAWLRPYQSHLRHDAMQLGIAAKLLERELRRAKGVDRAAAYIKAKRVAWHLNRAAAHADAAADSLFRTWKRFEEQYADQRKGSAGKAKFDLNA